MTLSPRTVDLYQSTNLAWVSASLLKQVLLCGSMPKVPKKLGIFTERGWLIVLAVAVGLVLGMGPTSAQFFIFGG